MVCHFHYDADAAGIPIHSFDHRLAVVHWFTKLNCYTVVHLYVSLCRCIASLVSTEIPYSIFIIITCSGPFHFSQLRIGGGDGGSVTSINIMLTSACGAAHKNGTRPRMHKRDCSYDDDDDVCLYDSVFGVDVCALVRCGVCETIKKASATVGRSIKK